VACCLSSGLGEFGANKPLFVLAGHLLSGPAGALLQQQHEAHGAEELAPRTVCKRATSLDEHEPQKWRLFFTKSNTSGAQTRGGPTESTQRD